MKSFFSKILLLFTLLLIVTPGCYTQEGELVLPEDVDQPTAKEVEVTIELPPNAGFSSSDLSVESLLTEENPVSGNLSSAEILTGEQMETVAAD